MSQQQTKYFHIGDILSITTGKMVSPKGMDGIYKILNYMTGENLYTHQLPRAMRACAPYLLQQHPQLASVVTVNSEINEFNYKLWLFEQIGIYGKELPVKPLPKGQYQAMHPVEEAIWMRGSNEGIIIASPNEKGDRK